MSIFLATSQITPLKEDGEVESLVRGLHDGKEIVLLKRGKREGNVLNPMRRRNEFVPGVLALESAPVGLYL